MQIEGASALVTGGASGLGAATVRRLCDLGARCTIVDRNAPLGEALAAELGDAATFVTADVGDEGEVAAAVEHAAEQAPLRIVVSCAGVGAAMRVISRDGRPHDLGVFDHVMKVNLVGTFNVIRLAALSMSRNEPSGDGERGVIINTASIAAFDGQIGQVAYSASKGAIVGMTLPVARDLATIGVRCVTIAPGTMDTPLLGQLPEDARRVLGEGIPFPKRLGTPEDFASLVVHVCENNYLNGEVIRLDGALRMPPR